VAHTPPRRQGLAGGLGSELGEDCPQGSDARRERVGVIIDDIVKLLGESGGFVVGQVKVHGPDMGSRLAAIDAPKSRRGRQGSR
jgi:hypothetical protein